MNTPMYGRITTKIVHSAFAQPERSRLRKMSAKMTISSQIQMMKKKNSSMDRKTCPDPNELAYATIHPTSVGEHSDSHRDWRSGFKFGQVSGPTFTRRLQSDRLRRTICPLSPPIGPVKAATLRL